MHRLGAMCLILGGRVLVVVGMGILTLSLTSCVGVIPHALQTVGIMFAPTAVGPAFAPTRRLDERAPYLMVLTLDDPPAAATPGSTFAVKETVENYGGKAVNVDVRYYLLAEESKSGPIPLIGGRHIQEVSSMKGSPAADTMVTIPGGTPAGTYRLVACPVHAAEAEGKGGLEFPKCRRSERPTTVSDDR